ncbi:hypothetical protein RvY_02390-1 [Ramazzottius varieornatus]|uniref:UNC93-like protein MFSD11 n=1 Tax=Ramazzottius varieornatus TaxID=947166 RepID=A0A1D1UQF3_RAMVA|nr:hypothetical protein RvY_02390-1 [Ramazzottius varieornatus]
MRRRSMPPQRMALRHLTVHDANQSRSKSIPGSRGGKDAPRVTPRTSMGNIAVVIGESIANNQSQTCSSVNRAPSNDKEPDHLLSGKVLGCPVTFLNVLLMGFGFMLNVGAGEATFQIQTVVLNSVNDEWFQGTPILGYSLSAICSATQFIGYALGPPFVAFTGPKLGMVIGSLCICFYVGTYIRPLTIPLYFGSALFGLGLGALWTVQGYFITVNSLPKDVLRNTGIFLALYQSSLTSASLFYFLMVRGSLSITWETRIVVFSSLLAISFVGVIAFSLVVHPWTGKIPLGPETIISERREQPSVGSDHTRGSRSPDEHPKTAETHRRPWSAFLSTVKFIWTRNILMLTPYFIYIGKQSLGLFQS